MLKIPEIELGSLLLSICILLGFIATAFVFVRFTIIGINYVKENFSEKVDKGEENKNKIKRKGF